MRNIRVTIEYDGTRYQGWQIQRKAQGAKRKARTIQETIEKALRQILQETVKLIGSGRTDAGVHAKGQVANFKTKSQLALEKIQRGLNAVLPGDIAIVGIEEAAPDFHSRFDAKSKIYRYAILNRPYRSVFDKERVHFVPYRLNAGLMKREIKGLIGSHDFKSFQKTDKSKRSSQRTMRSITLTEKGDYLFVDFEATGFLYKMVRNIVGTLIEIGRGRLNKGSIQRILASKDRRSAGRTAPAKGLCLVKVNY